MRNRPVPRARPSAPPGARVARREGLSWLPMSAETPPAPEAHLVVGFDDTPPASRALDAAARLLSVRPPGRITVVWVAHLASTVEMSADAVAIVENDFDQVAGELRTVAAERLAGSGLSWDFRWRQSLIAPELVAAAQEIAAARPDD